ncbi:putative lanthionine synthetase C-like protein [Actinacidiphila reveromycinica]|uniref:Putative lanthionine synthetase C-like protein n=1 Tax=Actinacidiphila reveromycinica TaxID=659352 RepID=A0A7U3UQM4_9ACTN|nr:lanthionine synthetase C family protein [Streptomyces sp. SN-593]BBA96891.1 putative lanthionine synthetase C-like protein [Streptomyces sp. SN-593]
MTDRSAHAVATAVANRLADPARAPAAATANASRQHLAFGPTGIALLHIERAAAGLGPWQRAHDWLAAATRQPFTSGPDSHPFYGAPALAHALACAADHLPGSYRRSLSLLDQQMTADTRRRLDAAHRRIDTGQLPALREFDALRGLAGYGTYLLRRDPTGPVTRAILDYCVRLTEPITRGIEHLPGWWAPTGPSGRPDGQFPGGHANHGMAHGVGAVLALLALSARRGTTVTGHHPAMRAILAWLEKWKTTSGRGTAWPYWITRDELRSGQLPASVPRRPSWCYGTAGLARAQQLAALALADTDLQREAEAALLNALTDPAQLRATTDSGLCHGIAGLIHLTARTAADAAPATADQFRAIIPALLAVLLPLGTAPDEAATRLLEDEAGAGLLDGAAGTALGLLAIDSSAPPHTAWDACLLTA